MVHCDRGGAYDLRTVVVWLAESRSGPVIPKLTRNGEHQWGPRRRLCGRDSNQRRLRRCQASRVSGVTMLANRRSPFRPTDLPLTANLWRWSSVKRGRLPSCSWRTRTSSCRYSMTACCRRFVHPAKQTSRKDNGFIARLSLDRSGTTSFALERTTSALLAIPTISTNSIRSNFRTLRVRKATADWAIIARR